MLERGAKIILIRPAPVPGYEGRRSFALPEFDPFWAKVAEADIAVGMHASDDGLTRYYNDWDGTHGGELLPFAGGKSAFIGHRAHAEPGHLRHGRFAHRPRSAHSLPDAAHPARRERVRLGAPDRRGAHAFLRARARTSTTRTR